MLKNRATRHLREIKMSYFSHMKRSLDISLRLGRGCFFAAIHSIAPFFFESASSDLIHKLHEELEKSS